MENNSIRVTILLFFFFFSRFFFLFACQNFCKVIKVLCSSQLTITHHTRDQPETHTIIVSVSNRVRGTIASVKTQFTHHRFYELAMHSCIFVYGINFIQQTNKQTKSNLKIVCTSWRVHRYPWCQNLVMGKVFLNYVHILFSRVSYFLCKLWTVWGKLL